MTAPEPELVQRAVRGDPAATAALLELLRPGIVRYCRAHLGRVGGRYTTADDVAQEVCLAVLHLAVAPVDTLGEREDSTPGPEQQAIAKDLGRRLSRLLRHLPELHREIVVLRVAVGLTAEEVGRTLDMSPGAVRVAQSRALARLRTLANTAFDEVPA
jgi:RNA polymerase sigma-70 factor, ECF subfamily